mmetsp:Transcript_22807/g.40886  ORF Transcript_22807/g.40886 Transcript_22807/m.40886 type:complete len:162 (-) Transcript_22807:57-542(-)
MSCISKSSSHFLRSGVDDDNDHGPAGVVKVRYPQEGEISSMTTCDPRVISQGCAVWNTRLVIASVGLSVSEVHRDTLIALSNSLNNGTFVEYVPDLISTTYLGPQPDAQIIHEPEPSDDNYRPSGSTAISLLVPLLGAAGVAFFARKHCFQGRLMSIPFVR